MAHAVQLWNHLPQSRSQLSPVELFTSAKLPAPDVIRNAHASGCPVWALDPKRQNDPQVVDVFPAGNVRHSIPRTLFYRLSGPKPEDRHRVASIDIDLADLVVSDAAAGAHSEPRVKMPYAEIEDASDKSYASSKVAAQDWINKGYSVFLKDYDPRLSISSNHLRSLDSQPVAHAFTS